MTVIGGEEFVDYPPLAYHATALHSFFPISMTIEIEMRE